MSFRKKYLIILAAVGLLSILLSYFSADCLTQIIHRTRIRFDIFLVLTLCTIALFTSFVLVKVALYFKFIQKIKFVKEGITLMITTVVFMPFIFQCLEDIKTGIIQKPIRQALCEKIDSEVYLAFGTKGKNLTNNEFTYLAKLIDLNNLPKRPNDAFEISYLYCFDGFLPDYTLDVEYKLPKTKSRNLESLEKFELDQNRKHIIRESYDHFVITYSEFVH